MNSNAREALRMSVPWRAGWLFNIGIMSVRSHAPGPAPRFRALNTPGDLALLESPPSWTFQLGLAARPTRPICHVWADSFLIEFSWDGRVCQALGVMVAPGVLAGMTDAPVVPTLFSASHEVHRAAHAEWVGVGHQQVALVRQSAGNVLRFALAVGMEPHNVVMARAQSALDLSPQAAFEEAAQWRQEVYGRLQKTPFGTDALCVEALESLLARIELPWGQIPHVWCAAELRPPAYFDVDDAFLFAAAWSIVEPLVAEDMIRAIFALQRHDGAVPCRLMAGGSADYSHPPAPLLAQAAALIARRTTQPTFVRSALPALRNYLSWTLDHFAAEFDATVRHTESGRNDAPPHADEERGGLALMLLGEIHALQELSRMAAVSLERSFWSESERIRSFLESHSWMRWAASSAAETRAESRRNRPSPIALLALRCPSLPQDFRDALLRRWENHLEDIGEVSNISWTDLVLLLHTLQSSDAQAGAARLAALIWRRAQKEAASLAMAQGQAARLAPGNAPVSLSASVSAAMLYASAPPTISQGRAKGRAAGLLDWAERHSAAALATFLAIPCAIFIAATATTLLRKAPPSAQIEASMGLAQSLYRMGYYDDAIAIYEDLLQKGGPGGAQIRVMLGNAYFRSGKLPSAEKFFRMALERNQQAPQAMLNLALTLYRQGRYEESSELYARFVDEYGKQYPATSAKVQTLLYLLQQRMTNSSSAVPNQSVM
jgi:tetratricopeptide (TPR) repeat protein